MQQRLKFQNSRGEQLAGIMHLPDAGAIRACVLFAHCFTCTKNIKAALTIADALAEQGFGVLRFDFTGLGQSEGDFSDTHFSSNVQDLVDAADFMAQSFEAPAILVGHSLGGTAVLAAAHHITSVVAVATIGAPASREKPQVAQILPTTIQISSNSQNSIGFEIDLSIIQKHNAFEIFIFYLKTCE